jgi:hypothetical protein
LGFFYEGDEVIVPANTYIASILAITDNNLVPVFVEPDPKTFNLDFSKIVNHITNRTKAIMIVHLYGRICWSEELVWLAASSCYCSSWVTTWSYSLWDARLLVNSRWMLMRDAVSVRTIGVATFTLFE